jgi:hypothetical protein
VDGQNNVDAKQQQRTANWHRGRFQGAVTGIPLQVAMPWILLAAWLIVDLAIFAYWRSQDWGMFGDVLLLMAFAGGVVALEGWLTAWLILASISIFQRLLYFLLGIGCMLAIIHSAGGEWKLDIDLAIQIAKPIVGCATVFLVLRRRGCEITPILGEPSERAGFVRHLTRVTLIDLFILTTGAALLSGLVMADDELPLIDFVSSAVLVSAAAFVTIFCLSARRYWVAAVTSVVMVPVVSALAISTIDRGNDQIFTIMNCSAVVCLLFVTGSLRLSGYRLTRA